MTLVMGRRQAVCRRNIPACGGGRRGVEAVSRYIAGIVRLRISCVRGPADSCVGYRSKHVISGRARQDVMDANRNGSSIKGALVLDWAVGASKAAGRHFLECSVLYEVGI